MVETKKPRTRLGFKVTLYNESWSGQRESTPHYQLGRLNGKYLQTIEIKKYFKNK